MAYPMNIRVKAIEYCVAGLTDEEIGERLDISKHTVGVWKRQLLKTGSLDKKKVDRQSGTPYKYKPERMKELLERSKVSESVNLDKSVKSAIAAKAAKKDAGFRDSGSQGIPMKKPKKKKDKNKDRGYDYEY